MYSARPAAGTAHSEPNISASPTTSRREMYQVQKHTHADRILPLLHHDADREEVLAPCTRALLLRLPLARTIENARIGQRTRPHPNRRALRLRDRDARARMHRQLVHVERNHRAVEHLPRRAHHASPHRRLLPVVIVLLILGKVVFARDDDGTRPAKVERAALVRGAEEAVEVLEEEGESLVRDRLAVVRAVGICTREDNMLWWRGAVWRKRGRETVHGGRRECGCRSPVLDGLPALMRGARENRGRNVRRTPDNARKLGGVICVRHGDRTPLLVALLYGRRGLCKDLLPLQTCAQVAATITGNGGGGGRATQKARASVA
ncbi:hypothetical protein K438DRAFT_1843071 [Mycena galopus ATCC 62051]|nr:hypothetical protein K438DRAFT_1843071 [Mycena galopus ATCC 62051]